MIKAEDILHAWTRKTRAVLNPSVQESLQQQVKLFAELTFPTEQPKELSRCEREREQHTNKKEALGGGTCKSRGRVPTHGCQQASRHGSPRILVTPERKRGKAQEAYNTTRGGFSLSHEIPP